MKAIVQDRYGPLAHWRACLHFAAGHARRKVSIAV